jgi:hypothetical protein
VPHYRIKSYRGSWPVSLRNGHWNAVAGTQQQQGAATDTANVLLQAALPALPALPAIALSRETAAVAPLQELPPLAPISAPSTPALPPLDALPRLQEPVSR